MKQQFNDGDQVLALFLPVVGTLYESLWAKYCETANVRTE